MPEFGVYNKSNLERIGLARQEQAQDAPKKPLEPIEALTRTMSELEHAIRDLRKGLRTKDNWADLLVTNTNTVPATGNGHEFDCHRLNGGIPWTSLTIDSVGGAGTTMTVRINGGRSFGVAAGDVFDNMEIYSFTIFVGTGATGTGQFFVTSYIPGIGGYKGIQ